METIIRDVDDWQLLLHAAESGDAHAQLEIALHYDNGLSLNGAEVLAPDAKLAYDWIKRAYENGNPNAAEYYAYHLSTGCIVKRIHGWQ